MPDLPTVGEVSGVPAWEPVTDPPKIPRVPVEGEATMAATKTVGRRGARSRHSGANMFGVSAFKQSYFPAFEVQMNESGFVKLVSMIVLKGA